MEIKNRLFPYPVLCGETDDYLSTTNFEVASNTRDSVHELILEYEYNVQCDSIETLLRKGAAEYVLHIECSTTSFRIALKSEVPLIQYRLQKSMINGEIALVAMIIAKMDIDNFKSQELNEDYAGETVSFKKGSILAYQNLPPIFVSKKTEDLANNESFFSIIKQRSLDPEEKKPLSFNLNNDKIQILVDEKTYDAFIHYQQSQSIALAMLVLPALAFMISEVRDNPENYERFVWFQRFQKFYKLHGKSFVDDILYSEDNPINIAQEMLQNPISCAYRDLYALEA